MYYVYCKQKGDIVTYLKTILEDREIKLFQIKDNVKKEVKSIGFKKGLQFEI